MFRGKRQDFIRVLHGTITERGYFGRVEGAPTRAQMKLIKSEPGPRASDRDKEITLDRF